MTDEQTGRRQIPLAVATAAFFPVGVVSSGVTVGGVAEGSWGLAAPAFMLALVSWAIVGKGVRRATRRRGD